MQPIDVLWVGLGGGAGSVFRWFVGRVCAERYTGPFPLGVFVINVSGAFVIAYLSVLFGVDWQHRYGASLNAAVLTGFLGGYTTFSSMQLDALNLRREGRRLHALGYIVLSVGAGLAAAAAGVWLAQRLG